MERRPGWRRAAWSVILKPMPLILAGFFLSLLAGPAAAGPYAGTGLGFTESSASPALSLGYRSPGKAWRGELGGELLDRERGRSSPSGTLGPSIAAERFNLRTRFFYADLSHALPKAHSESWTPSGFELGLGAALIRAAKMTRVEQKGGLPELYSYDVVWRLFPELRVAFVRTVHPQLELGLEGRYILTGDAHGGKGTGGWRFQLGLRWHLS